MEDQNKDAALGKISDILTNDQIEAAKNEAQDNLLNTEVFTKEQLVKAMYLYNMQVRMTPEAFKNTGDALADAKGQIEYLISLID